MAEKNFFNLKLIHPVINRFAEDHYICIKCYQEAYAFLDDIESEEPEDEGEGMEVMIKLYRGICQHYSDLQEAYHNFIISYFEFKETAKSNELVKAEFNKLPIDFAPVKEHFEQLIDGYAVSVNRMKKRI